MLTLSTKRSDMSERGSFVTSFVYCARCLEAVKSALERHGLEWVPVAGAEGRGVIAGYIRAFYQGEELHIFEPIICELMETTRCHFSIAVVGESASQIFDIKGEGPEH